MLPKQAKMLEDVDDAEGGMKYRDPYLTTTGVDTRLWPCPRCFSGKDDDCVDEMDGRPLIAPHPERVVEAMKPHPN